MNEYKIHLGKENFNRQGKFDLNELSSVKTINKSNIMMFELHKKMLSIHLDESMNESTTAHLEKYSYEVGATVSNTFHILDSIKAFIQSDFTSGTHEASAAAR
mmetsp:Transcript_16448/g.25404  ORF Transcript_16448/g.25404 Transcript_16448/m.25404 type:complete len:103 (-) Transcript_16448:2553-2861(-)